MEAISIGQTVSHRFRVSAEDHLAFQKLSGDTSLIHTDVNFARSNGFDDVICYGGITLAHLSHVLGMKIPGPRGTSLKWEINFRSPLYINEDAEVSLTVSTISQSTGMVISEFNVVTLTGRTIATGKTQSLLPKGQ